MWLFLNIFIFINQNLILNYKLHQLHRRDRLTRLNITPGRQYDMHIFKLDVDRDEQMAQIKTLWKWHCLRGKICPEKHMDSGFSLICCPRFGRTSRHLHACETFLSYSKTNEDPDADALPRSCLSESNGLFLCHVYTSAPAWKRWNNVWCNTT